MVRRSEKKKTKAAKAPSRTPATLDGEHDVDGTRTEAATTNYVRAWRLYRGIKSQTRCAELAGMTRPSLSRLESGTLPYRQWMLEKLAAVLDTSPANLIGVDPYVSADIFKIYTALPEDHRREALAFISGLSKKPKRSR